MSEITPDGFRVRAEIHFARGNYLSAMQNYLECLIAATNYFNKPWNSSGQVSDVIKLFFVVIDEDAKLVFFGQVKLE
jgi:hypothetical protein